MKSLQLGLLTTTALMALGTATVARADTVVQIPIDSLLNARPVSTLTNGVVVPWSPTQGVDGNGGSDGFVTTAVEANLGQVGTALPDDGLFPAANGIPEIQLHFSNTNTATSFQALNAHSGAAASIQFAVPQAMYTNIFLIMTSSEGPDELTVTMTYADSTTSMTSPFTLPDYDTSLPADTAEVAYFALISMHKWTSTDQQTDNAGHMITGVRLTPTPTKPLTGIEIAKPADGQYLVFWGATGLATSPVDAGTTASGDATTGMEGGTDAAQSSGGDSSDAPSDESTSDGSGAALDSDASGGPSSNSDGSGASVLDSSTSAGDSGAAGANATSGGGCAVSGKSRQDTFAWGLLIAIGALVRGRSSSRRGPRQAQAQHHR